MPPSVASLTHTVAATAHARSKLSRGTVDDIAVRVLNPQTLKEFGEGSNSLESRSGGIDFSQSRAFLKSFVLSNEIGLTKIFHSGCKILHCERVNRIPLRNVNSVTRNIFVPRCNLDDLILSTNTWKFRFHKIHVEGHELEVVQSGLDLIRRSFLQYIVLEFSPKGQSGVEWNNDRLNESFEQKFACLHLRGFEKCHDNTLRLSSFKCNFRFA